MEPIDKLEMIEIFTLLALQHWEQEQLLRTTPTFLPTSSVSIIGGNIDFLFGLFTERRW